MLANLNKSLRKSASHLTVTHFSILRHCELQREWPAEPFDAHLTPNEKVGVLVRSCVSSD
jgi:hypothetical protein